MEPPLPLKSYLLATASLIDDTSPGGVVAATMRHLATAAPTATGATLISPDGTVRYISRAEAERYTFGPHHEEGRH